MGRTSDPVTATDAARFIRARLKAILSENNARQWMNAHEDNDLRLREKCRQLHRDTENGNLSDSDSRVIGELMTRLLEWAGK